MTLLTRRWSRLPETGRVLQRGAAVSFVSTLGVLVFAGPAMADSTVYLKEAHQNTKAADFSSQNCGAEGLTPAVAGEDGWHFVLPSRGSSGAEFTSLRLTFEKHNGDEVERVLDVRSGVDKTDFRGEGGVAGRHGVAYTPAGWTLMNGKATVSGDAGRGVDEFVLSHVCPGDEPEEPEKPGKPDNPGNPGPPDDLPSELPDDVETPSTPEESAVVDQPTKEAPQSEESEEQQLPVTGVAIGGIVLTGLGLVGAGVAMRVLRRRGDDPDESTEE